MIKKIVGSVSLLLLGLAQPAFADDEKNWETVSNIGAYGLTAVAIGAPLVKGDEQGALQAGGSYLAGQALTQTLKEIFPTTRPDGSDRRSFPSGHSATAFAAAASIYERQGPEAGIPALAVAGLVGVARVKARKHRWGEVLVGAGIGLGSGLLITNKPPAKNMAILPWSDGKGGGIDLVMRF